MDEERGKQNKQLARERALVILQVRSGAITVKEGAKLRQTIVLEKMKEKGIISERQALYWELKPIVLAQEVPEIEQESPQPMHTNG
jgi:membrane carboxypeptidase/penicillin-binding protein